MPVVAVAVCPHPPLIVPEVAGAAAAELDDLRAACDTAVDRLLGASPEIVIIIGDGPATVRFGPADYGSLRPFGVDRRLHLMKVTCGSRSDLPLSLQIGAWLLHRGKAGCLRLGQAVTAAASPTECAELGATLAGDDARVGLLVMGDGSACRGQKAPGYHDPRAQPYDDRVADALATGDAAALLDLDPGLSKELKVAGRAPWQVLAGAVRAGGDSWHSELTYYAAPYGVAYFVAVWEPVRADRGRSAADAGSLRSAADAGSLAGEGSA